MQRTGGKSASQTLKERGLVESNDPSVSFTSRGGDVMQSPEEQKKIIHESQLFLEYNIAQEVGTFAIGCILALCYVLFTNDHILRNFF